MSLERYSSTGRLHEQRMRLIGAIMGAKLMEESRFSEAEEYVTPLINWAKDPLETSHFLTPQQTNDRQVNYGIIVADILGKGDRCTKEELREASDKLVMALNELKSSKR